MRINLIIGSLVGAFTIYGVLAACSSGPGAGLLADAGLIDANNDGHDDGPVSRAEAATPDCAQWEFKVVQAPALNTPFNTGAWEPVGGHLVNSSTGETEIALRRCVP
jgi:hypothetical protein